ncbi:MAG: PASTA domain-containing protein, partial [Oscillospiraceae bacterium]|nr:PASTA domain-containing protein [Oscillospiraceae bacterium]
GIPEILYFLIAPISFIVMLVCIIRLIIAKKEKRRQMKKVKIAAVISAIIVAIIAAMTIYAFIMLPPPTPPPPPVVERMPNIVGLTYAECKENYSDKFDLVVQEKLWSFDYPEGAIIEQIPPVDSEYLVGDTTVKCMISKGPRMVTVSNVIGLDFEDARTILADSDGFTVGYVSEYSDSVPKGKVVATDPPAGEKAAYGSAVKVTVSGGKEPDTLDDTK